MYRIIFFVAFIALSSCRYTPMEPKFSGNYPANINAIIEANCLGGNCHSSSTDLNVHLDLSSWEAMTKGSIYFNEIIPFNIRKSHFFGHINTDTNTASIINPTMPLDRTPLSKSEQKEFLDWINEGAKNDNGKIPYSDISKRVFVASQEENMISVIDADTKRLVRVISANSDGISQPSAIAIMPDHKSFIIGKLGDKGLIRKINAADYQTVNEFNSNISPNEIAIIPDGSKGYITDNSSLASTNFTVFNPVTMNLTKTISTPLILQPYGVIAAPNGRHVYMSGLSSDNILRIDIQNDSVVGNLPLGSDVPVPVTQDYIREYMPSVMAISSDSKRLYVACVNSIEVVEFDLQTDSIIKRISLPISPRTLALSPDGSELWTATWANKVFVTSTSTHELLATIDSVSDVPHAMSFTPDGSYVYIACESLTGGGHHHSSTGAEVPPSSVVVIERKSRKIVSAITMPGYSVGVVMGYGN